MIAGQPELDVVPFVRHGVLDKCQLKPRSCGKGENLPLS